MYLVSPIISSNKINSSLSPHYVNIHGIPRGSILGPILFIIYILPINYIFHKYYNIHYYLYADDLQIYMSFPISSYSDMIQLSMFNCITELTECFSHNYISLNMITTDNIIFSRPSSPQSITHHFLLSHPTSQYITTLGLL